MGTKTIVVILAVLAISLQGCFITVNGDGSCSGKMKKGEESAVKTTLNAIDKIPNEEGKIAALRALVDKPMRSDDYNAVIKAIEGIQDAQAREELLITAINALNAIDYPKPTPKKKNCN